MRPKMRNVRMARNAQDDLEVLDFYFERVMAIGLIVTVLAIPFLM